MRRIFLSSKHSLLLDIENGMQLFLLYYSLLFDTAMVQVPRANRSYEYALIIDPPNKTPPDFRPRVLYYSAADDVGNQSLPVSSGTALNRSATRPRSATWKIGASSSLLMAMMVLESFMPARCWIAPEMPTAM